MKFCGRICAVVLTKKIRGGKSKYKPDASALILALALKFIFIIIHVKVNSLYDLDERFSGKCFVFVCIFFRFRHTTHTTWREKVIWKTEIIWKNWTKWWIDDSRLYWKNGRNTASGSGEIPWRFLSLWKGIPKIPPVGESKSFGNEADHRGSRFITDREYRRSSGNRERCRGNTYKKWKNEKSGSTCQKNRRRTGLLHYKNNNVKSFRRKLLFPSNGDWHRFWQM